MNFNKCTTPVEHDSGGGCVGAEGMWEVSVLSVNLKTALKEEVFYNNKQESMCVLFQMVVVQPVLRSKEVWTEKENHQVIVGLSTKSTAQGEKTAR